MHCHATRWLQFPGRARRVVLWGRKAHSDGCFLRPGQAVNAVNGQRALMQNPGLGPSVRSTHSCGRKAVGECSIFGG